MEIVILKQKKTILLNIFLLVAFKQKEESDYFPCSRLVMRKQPTINSSIEADGQTEQIDCISPTSLIYVFDPLLLPHIASKRTDKFKQNKLTIYIYFM